MRFVIGAMPQLSCSPEIKLPILSHCKRRHKEFESISSIHWHRHIFVFRTQYNDKVNEKKKKSNIIHSNFHKVIWLNLNTKMERYEGTCDSWLWEMNNMDAWRGLVANTDDSWEGRLMQPHSRTHLPYNIVHVATAWRETQFDFDDKSLGGNQHSTY